MLAPAHSQAPAIVRTMDGTGRVAGFRLKQTLAVAIREFGRPTEQFTPAACEISWPALHLSGTFVPGRTSGTRRTCSPQGRASSLRAGATWSTAAGLRVGDRVSAIDRHYPGVEPPYSTPSGYSYYSLTRPGSAETGVTLRAEAHAGRVDAHPGRGLYAVTAPSSRATSAFSSSISTVIRAIRSRSSPCSEANVVSGARTSPTG